MKRTAAYRITADLCFYFSILSIFPSMRPWQLPMLLFVAAAFVVTLIAVHCQSLPLRLLLSLLPGLCFLGAELRFLLFFPALAWLYLILVLTAGKFSMYLDDYRRIYRFMLIVCLCALAANVANSLIDRAGNVISYYSMGYALAFLFCGMLAMREMQMNAKMDLTWRVMNAATVIGVPLLAIGGSLLLFMILRSIEPVVRFLFQPIGMFLMWLFGRLFPGTYEEPVATPAPLSTPLPTPPLIDMDPVSEGRQLLEENFESNLALQKVVEKATTIGGYVVLAALILFALWIVLRYARLNRAGAGDDEYLYEETEAALPPRKKRSARASVIPGNAEHLRRIYRKYMELMREKGVRIQKDSTSQEILDEAEATGLSPAAQRLRELYLKARYDDDSKITREDVQEAQRCLQQIREEENLKS